MSEWIALGSAFLGIVYLILKWYYGKWKREPKRSRVNYVEKELAKAKRKLDEYAGRDNLFGLSAHGSDLHDRVSTLNEMEDSKRRKDPGKTGKG